MKIKADWNTEEAIKIIHSYKNTRDELMPILHQLNDCFGFINQSIISEISQHLNISAAEVHGVISFYHDFAVEEQPKKLLKICCGEACQANGANNLIEEIEQKYNLSFHQTNTEINVKMVPVYCYGNCVCGPTVMFQDELISHTSMKSIANLIDN